ncbi:XtrA/YqaO family protein [Bacillus sp. FJAT-52991]|uniref:XtrA/YqaO family protein n=1 Tax=Bacillus kandeliae TaxID=3129297 RepID=A0ABZ2NAS8_9BACI
MSIEVQALELNEDLTVTSKLESDVVKVIILDGKKGTACSFYAVEHGQTVIETVKGKSVRVEHNSQTLLP